MCTDTNDSNVGRNKYGYYRFKRGFYGLSHSPTIFQKIDRALICQTPVSLDKSVETRVDNKKPRKKLFSELEKLQEAGYRANEKKS